MKLRILFFALIFVRSLSSAQETEKSIFLKIQESEYDAVDSYPQEMVNSVGEDSIELRKNASLVQRKGVTLFIKPVSGKIVNFVDVKEAGESERKYEYMGFLSGINCHLLFERGYETYSYLLVSQETGDITFIEGKPLISSDSKYFICSGENLDTDVSRSIVVYKAGNTPELLKSGELAGSAAIKVKWVNNKTIVVSADLRDKNGELRTEFYRVVWN